MQVQINRGDDLTENFYAMLLVKLDDFEKVCLWHEVYVQQK